MFALKLRIHSGNIYDHNDAEENVFFFFLVIRHPPSSTLFPYTALFRPRSIELTAVLIQVLGCRKGIERLPSLRDGGLGHAPRVAFLPGVIPPPSQSQQKRNPRSVAESDRKSTRLTPVTVKSRMPSSA